MAQTLKQLKTQLRFRLGEPTAGTWQDSLDYENESAVDEMANILNEAARKLSVDCHSMQVPILISERVVSVSKNAYRYGLPEDFLSIESVYHVHEGTWYQLQPYPLYGLLKGFRAGDVGVPYQYYEVRGAAAEILNEGVVTGVTDSNTVLIDANAVSPDFTQLGIIVDLHEVFNKRDDSRAVIKEVVSATQLRTDGLVGGASNLFQRNDGYQIETGEELNQILWVFPPASEGDQKTLVASQSALTFTPSIEAVLSSITVTPSAVAVNPLKVQLENSAIPGSPVQSVNPESIASVAETVAGKNVAYFETGIRLSPSITYRVACTDGAGATVTPTAIEVTAYSGTENLHIQYARYARTMVLPADACEIPEWGIPALLLYAESLAYMKMYGGRNPRSAEARAEYEVEVQKLKDFLRKANRSGPSRVKSVWLGTDRARRFSNLDPNVVRVY